MSNDMVNTANTSENTETIETLTTNSVDISIDANIPGASPKSLTIPQNKNTDDATLNNSKPFSLTDLTETIFDIKKEHTDDIPDSILDLSNVDEEDDIELAKKRNKQIADETAASMAPKPNANKDEFLKYFFSKVKVSQEYYQLQETYKNIFRNNQPLLDKKDPVEIHATSHMQATWNLSGGIKIHQVNDEFSFKFQHQKEGVDTAIKFILQIASSTEQKIIETKDKEFFDTIKNYTDGFGVKVKFINEIKDENNKKDNVVKFSQAKMMKTF